MLNPDRQTTIAGLGVGGSILVGMWDQVDLLLDSDPATGSWRVVVSLGVALVAAGYWAWMTNKIKTADDTPEENNDPQT